MLEKRWQEWLRFGRRPYISQDWNERYNNGLTLLAYEGFNKEGQKIVDGQGSVYLPCQALKWLKEHLGIVKVLKHKTDHTSHELWILVKTNKDWTYIVYIAKKDLPTQAIENFLKEVLSC